MKKIESRSPRGLIITVLLAGALFAACESPTGPSFSGEDVVTHGASAFSTERGEDAITIDLMEDTVMPYEDDATAAATPPNRPLTIITGRATYAAPGLSEVRLNVRVDAGGTVHGGGRVTLYGQESDFTATCVIEKASFGLVFYGISVRLHEPVLRFGSYYTYAAISLTDLGGLGSLVFATNDACRGSAVRYPYEPTSGNIRALVQG